ncbi:MAG: hypothetical protein LBV16_03780 [Elusimicrobiota bacterium]|nr:hypothetical protein [Elusimicrobiota bacterium]
MFYAVNNRRLAADILPPAVGFESYTISIPKGLNKIRQHIKIDEWRLCAHIIKGGFETRTLQGFGFFVFDFHGGNPFLMARVHGSKYKIPISF